ncbi:MAG: transcriptional regulator PpsR [Rubrivivax sp.]|nr:transcriptional regulator PpsR [Rubrivivax sp.]
MPRSAGEKYVLGSLDAKSATRLLNASSDIALVLDDDGTILEVLAQGDDTAARVARNWRGQSWVQTVTGESRQKVEAMLRDAQAAAEAASARWRQVNHPVDGDDELPLLYATVRLEDEDARGKPRSRIVAFGRDLRAVVSLQRRLIDTQQAMERDYWRFREAETRYRHLLETSSEAVLVVDGATQKILEANPAARALCGTTRAKLAGVALPSLFDAGSAERLQDLLAAARTAGRRESQPARLADGLTEVNVAASVFRQDDNAFMLVRLSPRARPVAAKVGARRGTPVRNSWEATFSAFVQNSPDSLVFCDEGGRVLSVNKAFLALAELTSEDQARGQPLDRWLGRTGVELGVLITNLRQRGSVGRFVTAVRGEYGTEIEVEISASQLAGEDTVLAFAIRDIERRVKAEPDGGRAMTRSVSELTELVGRTPLKDIVSETTDLIEQLCIETALEMSNDNRASAALLLGLSRQSLYVKLRRYGLGSLGGDE